MGKTVNRRADAEPGRDGSAPNLETSDRPGNGFTAWRKTAASEAVIERSGKLLKMGGKQWRIYIEFTMVFAVFWASDSSLRTVSIRG